MRSFRPPTLNPISSSGKLTTRSFLFLWGEQTVDDRVQRHRRRRNVRDLGIGDPVRNGHGPLAAFAWVVGEGQQEQGEVLDCAFQCRSEVRSRFSSSASFSAISLFCLPNYLGLIEKNPPSLNRFSRFGGCGQVSKPEIMPEDSVIRASYVPSFAPCFRTRPELQRTERPSLLRSTVTGSPSTTILSERQATLG